MSPYSSIEKFRNSCYFFAECSDVAELEEITLETLTEQLIDLTKTLLEPPQSVCATGPSLATHTPFLRVVRPLPPSKAVSIMGGGRNVQ